MCVNCWLKNITHHKLNVQIMLKKKQKNFKDIKCLGIYFQEMAVGNYISDRTNTRY